MPHFSKRSLDNLETCVPELQLVMHEAILEYDFMVLCGHRNKADQDKAFHGGFSKLKWPDSEHNTLPSEAVDIVPYPIDWSDIGRFKELSVVIKRVADRNGIKLDWGGDWERFKDYPHWQRRK